MEIETEIETELNSAVSSAVAGCRPTLSTMPKKKRFYSYRSMSMKPKECLRSDNFDVMLSLELHDVPNPLIQANLDKGLNDIANRLMFALHIRGGYLACSGVHCLLISLDHIELQRSLWTFLKGQFLGEFLWFCCLWEILIENGIREAVKLSTVLSVALSVGDWFFARVGVSAIDCPYPCDNTCHNLVFK
ncbi:hypothetical protein Syun_012448 [Stephania yunnanensis]|uniref:Pectin acetylesterase n=1 Tax=Stephania yunnanensis TaxID=152371 RepID=A0AAP0PFB7_9MAGN